MLAKVVGHQVQGAEKTQQDQIGLLERMQTYNNTVGPKKGRSASRHHGRSKSEFAQSRNVQRSAKKGRNQMKINILVRETGHSSFKVF